MSYLVSDFIINPVLRQARRFSRSSASSDQTEHPSNPRTPEGDTNHTQNETAITEVEEPSTYESSGEGNQTGTASGASERPNIPSPHDENEESRRVQIANIEQRPPSTTRIMELSGAIPYRNPSTNSRSGLFAEDVSDNPAFGMLEEFQRDLPPMAPLSGSTETGLDESPNPPSRSSTISIDRGTGMRRQRNTSLPEDDGMSELRQRIVAIQTMDVEVEQKAKLMHQLLTEEYSHSQQSMLPRPVSQAPSIPSIISQDRPSTPGSLGSFSFWKSNDVSSESSPENTSHTFHLTLDDVKPTFAPLPQQVPKDDPQDTMDAGFAGGADIDSEDAEPTQSLGCAHYRRNVKMQCSICNRWYTCRFCHDNVENHSLNRQETKNMLCMLCGCAQKAGEVCIGCGVRAAWYYCGVCKLWDDDASKSIYHCDECGICRVGRGLGKDYMHCKTCGVCIIISKEHKCIERASDCDCPICGEYLFNSPQKVVFMRCGHTIHHSCYYDLMKTSYKCPICSQSIVNMETQFRNLDRAVESQPMPPEFQDTQAVVSCNDCYAKSIVKYHWLGLKCGICDSYNTTQLQILSGPAAPEDQIADTDIIPGPRADIFAEDLVHMITRERSVYRPARMRRHSSHMRELSSSALEPHGSTLTISPYSLPHRLGRSVSPARGPGFFNQISTLTSRSNDTGSDDDDDDDDEPDFWGGDGRRSTEPKDVQRDDENDDDEYEDDSPSESDESEDEAEGEDRMELFGHR